MSHKKELQGLEKQTASVIVLEDEILAIGQDDCCTVSNPYVELI